MNIMNIRNGKLQTAEQFVRSTCFFNVCDQDLHVMAVKSFFQSELQKKQSAIKNLKNKQQATYILANCMD